MTRYRIAIVLALLAASAAMLFVGGGEARDPIDHQRPAVHSFDDISARSAAVARVSDDTVTLDAGAPIVLPDRGLIDEDAKVRLKVVTALTIDGGDQAVAALTTVALTDADPAVRQEAVYALGEMRTDAAIETLKHSLLDPEVRVREAAVDAFADVGGDKSALALATVLNDPDASLRFEVVDALGEIGGQIAIRMLRQASTDSHSAVREAAAEWLAELSAGEPAGVAYK
jgi:HEAT repeat protein